jgi:hypothetical protein
MPRFHEIKSAKISLYLSPREKNVEMSKILTVRNKEGLAVIKDEYECLKVDKDTLTQLIKQRKNMLKI